MIKAYYSEWLYELVLIENVVVMKNMVIGTRVIIARVVSEKETV